MINARTVYNQVSKMDDPMEAYGTALKYIADGGKICEADVAHEVTGSVKRATLNTGVKEKKSKEIRARDYLDMNAPTIVDVAHNLWESLPDFIQGIVEDHEIRNELITVVNTFDSRYDAACKFIESYGVAEQPKEELPSTWLPAITKMQEKKLNQILSVVEGLIVSGEKVEIAFLPAADQSTDLKATSVKLVAEVDKLLIPHLDSELKKYNKKVSITPKI